jgi:hypothetical protein
MDHYRCDIYYIPDTRAEGTPIANQTTKGKRLLWVLCDRITTMLATPPTLEEQRVVDSTDLIRREAEQRVIKESPKLPYHV